MQESEITYLPVTLYRRITLYDYHHTIYIHIDYDIDTSYTYLKKHILSQGGTENPEVLYKRFRGKSASNKALLERAGLV